MYGTSFRSFHTGNVCDAIRRHHAAFHYALNDAELVGGWRRQWLPALSVEQSSSWADYVGPSMKETARAHFWNSGRNRIYLNSNAGSILMYPAIR